GGGGSPGMGVARPASCDLPEQGITGMPDAASLPKMLQGSWLLCTKPSIFGTSDEDGLEFTLDGAFYKLYVNAAGAIERGTGFDKQGNWSIIDNGMQMNLLVPGGGFIPTHLAFATTPRKMRITTDSVNVGNYVIAP